MGRVGGLGWLVIGSVGSTSVQVGLSARSARDRLGSAQVQKTRRIQKSTRIRKSEPSPIIGCRDDGGENYDDGWGGLYDDKGDNESRRRRQRSSAAVTGHGRCGSVARLEISNEDDDERKATNNEKLQQS